VLFVEALNPADRKSVFLNVPFDKGYGPLFVALIAGLAGLGRKPRCVLEVPSGGRNRLDRIFGLIASCAAKYQREHRSEGPFHPYLFRQIAWTAAKLARSHGLVK